jgi:hypothetical protein
MLEGIASGTTRIGSEGPYTTDSYTTVAHLWDEDNTKYLNAEVDGSLEHIILPYGSWKFAVGQRIITSLGGLSISNVYWIVGVTWVSEFVTKIQVSGTEGGAPLMLTAGTGTVYGLLSPEDGFSVSVGVIDQIQVDAGDYQSSLVAGAKITTSSSGTFPTGISASTDYWINEASSSYLKISATNGGSTITGFTPGLYTGTVQVVIPSGSSGTLEKVSFSDADPSSGDWRVVAFALLDKIAKSFASIETANRPARFTCSKKTPGSDNVMVRTYNFSMNLTPPDESAETVLDE